MDIKKNKLMNKLMNLEMNEYKIAWTNKIWKEFLIFQTNILKNIGISEHLNFGIFGCWILGLLEYWNKKIFIGITY